MRYAFHNISSLVSNFIPFILFNNCKKWPYLKLKRTYFYISSSRLATFYEKMPQSHPILYYISRLLFEYSTLVKGKQNDIREFASWRVGGTPIKSFWIPESLRDPNSTENNV